MCLKHAVLVLQPVARSAYIASVGVVWLARLMRCGVNACSSLFSGVFLALRARTTPGWRCAAAEELHPLERWSIDARAALHLCGFTTLQHKNAIPRWKEMSLLPLAMENRWLVSTAYFCLSLLCSGVGQTPDSNEGKILCVGLRERI